MKYVVVKINEDGSKTALTLAGPLKPSRNSMRRMRAIGIRPVAIAEKNAKGKIIERAW
tara:strand:+ start:598 stop:771 length:174 start_codon:yes stop_codon:yes gene_type:complete